MNPALAIACCALRHVDYISLGIVAAAVTAAWDETSSSHVVYFDFWRDDIPIE